MKKLTISVAALLAGAIAAPGIASAETYANLGYTWFNADKVDVGGVTGRLGYNSRRILASKVKRRLASTTTRRRLAACR